jgi:putative transcriptional regulator
MPLSNPPDALSRLSGYTAFMQSSPLSFAMAILMLAMTAGPARPATLPPQVATLEGEFLVANRKMADPNFSRCVIYIVTHTEGGAMGLVVNRVLGTITRRDLFGDLGIENAAKIRVDLHYGGPVEQSRGFVLHSGDYTGASTQMFRNGIALSLGLDVIRAVAAGKGPRRVKFLSGYTGWAAGQLEAEIARGDWLVAPAGPELIFSSTPDPFWENALRRAGIPL